MRALELTLTMLLASCALSHERAVTSCGPPCDAGPPMHGDAWVERRDGGVDPVDAWVEPVDAYVGPRDADPRDTGTPPPLTRSGWVYVEDGPGSALPLDMSAYFSGSSIDDVRRGLWAPDCASIATAGSCYAARCPPTEHTSDLAGTVSVDVEGSRVMSADAPSIGMAFFGGSTFDAYLAFTATATAPIAGRVVTVRASGAAVPAFQTTLVAPPMLATTLPSSISRSRDLVVSWAPTSANQVWLALGPTAVATATTPWIVCTTSGTSGSLTVPASLLALYAAPQQLFLDALAFQVTTVAAPPYAVDVMVGNVVVAEPNLVP